MGISKGGAPIASAPTAAVPPVAAAPASKPAVGAQTVLGMPSPGHQPAAPVGMAASVASPPVAINPLTPPAGVDPLPKPEASPWAPPAAAAPAPAAPVVAAPAAPVVAAPQVPAAPQVAAAPAGKKKTQPAEEGGGKGKFRETMWFKKGDLDAQAAVAAAEERQRTGKDVATDKADSLPIDERYKDDGSISRSDKEKYSLRTGATMMMGAIKDAKASQSLNKIGEDVLVSEMKGGRTWIFLAIAAGVVAIGLIIAMLAR
jgi:hypothetical protein